MERRFTVAMVAAAPFRGPRGSQVLVRELAETLHADGHRVHVVAYGAGADDADPSGIRLHATPARLGGGAAFGPHPWRAVLDLALVGTLLRVVRREGIEVMHAHNYDGAAVAYAVRALTGVPVVYHAHNVMSDELGRYFRAAPSRRVASALGRVLDRTVPRRADAVVALSEAVAAYLRLNGVAGERLAVIPPGTLAASEQPEIAAATDLAPAEPGKVVVYAGNLDPYQEVGTLLEAMVAVCRTEPSARLVLATHSPAPSVARAAARLGLGGRVRLVVAESFAEVRRLLQRADLLVCPRASWSGFPIKLLNYMASGRPMLIAAGAARPLGDGPWTVVPDGDAGAMAQAIVAALRDPARQARLGLASLRRLREAHDWRFLTPQVVQLYGRVVARPRGGPGERAGTCEKVLQKATV